MFCLLTESGSGCSGCIGVFSTIANTRSVYGYGRYVADGYLGEMEVYMDAIQHGIKAKKPGSDMYEMATPHTIIAYHVGDCVIAVHSPAGDPWDEAIAIIYGQYHRLRDMYDGAVDDTFVDQLLLVVGRWQEQSASHNEIVVRLAQAVFKPELV